ncbi:potential E3 ubiquitin-protein ligase ariadne-2-like isoform X3 [Heterodontus francisci]|uniref:potential E3 ubiquitin-protein ligase ariadne-2-like isoform X3 n=1 Tax=Heterodontus francisci TaxID=7792 RepID=UPI00355B4593
MDTAQERHGASQGVCHLADTSSSSSLRAKASCGHITEPLSLKAWAKARIEMCPDCNFLVQRVDLQSLCVECLFCSNARGKLYQFCWDCLREWKSPASHSTDCGNKSCTITAMLLSCPLIEAPDIEVHQCPVVRACPNCEALVSHCLEGCPQVECPNCFHSFCYRCLGIEECNYAEIVELSDDDDTDYENCDDSSECIRAGRQKITGRKNYKINPTYKLNEDVTDN